MNHVTIKGLPEVSRKLRGVEAALGRKIIRRAFRAALKPMAATIKSLEPEGETGTLRKAVKVMSGRGRKGRITMRIVIGKNAFKGGKFYGAFRDLGTAKKAGSDAMREGFDRDAERTKDDAERLILEGIEAALKT